MGRNWFSSDSTQKTNTSGKNPSDDPIKFSASKAKSQTLDDTLGAQKSDSSFPVYLGLGVLSFIMYFAFIRKEDPSEAERWDVLKMRAEEKEVAEKTEEESITDPVR